MASQAMERLSKWASNKSYGAQRWAGVGSGGSSNAFSSVGNMPF